MADALRETFRGFGLGIVGFSVAECSGSALLDSRGTGPPNHVMQGSAHGAWLHPWSTHWCNVGGFWVFVALVTPLELVVNGLP